MPRRSDALIPLSHGHHKALYLAKLIKDSDDPVAARRAFTEFWDEHGIEHFRSEEEVLLPLSGLPGPSADADVARMLDEHLDIRRRATAVLAGEATLDEMKQLGSNLFDHVRFEERELFPRIEAQLDEEQMRVLAAAIEDTPGTC
ncbi:MAG: hemerythrin domain-containing protein [Actinomycetota bacterium]|nr:hemerythrin domain-containing protein [Actinomycetota bacterium]